MFRHLLQTVRSSADDLPWWVYGLQAVALIGASALIVLRPQVLVALAASFVFGSGILSAVVAWNLRERQKPPDRPLE